MTRQLPEGAEGAVVLTLIYSYISWVCSGLMIWLTWVHNERLSYVACISYYTLLATTASIIQQAHDIACWRDIAIEQYERRIANPNSGDVTIANGSVGLDLVLYYIQFYSYIAQSLFLLFWASELAQSVYGLIEKSSWRSVLRKLNASGKIASAVLPLVFVLGIQTRHFRNQTTSEDFILILGVPFLISLGLGILLMLAILFRYIQSRWNLVQFDPHNRISANSNGSGSALTSRNSQGRSSARVSRHKKSIYDKWLMTRFTIAFLLLAAFQVSSILFDQTARKNARKDLEATGPDLSADRASRAFYQFLPGNTPGIALFVVFGTTATFRSHMYRTFVPQQWQRPNRRGSTPSLTRGLSTRTTATMERTATAATRKSEDVFSLQDNKDRKTPIVVTTTTTTMISKPPPPNHDRGSNTNNNNNDSGNANSDRNDDAGFSLSVYEPPRPGRAFQYNGSNNENDRYNRDLELGFVRNHSTTIRSSRFFYSGRARYGSWQPMTTENR